jgi:hypothetical protein
MDADLGGPEEGGENGERRRPEAAAASRLVTRFEARSR